MVHLEELWYICRICFDLLPYVYRVEALSHPPFVQNPCNVSLNLLRLQLDSLPIHEDALSLVRLRYPPLPDLCRVLVHHLFHWSFQQYTRRLRCACFHAKRDAKLDRMRVADLQRNELLSWVLRLDRDCRGFDRCSVSHSDQSQNGGMSFRYPKDVIVQVCSGGTCDC